MPHTCENCNANPVEIARKTTGTPTAKLIASIEEWSSNRRRIAR